MAFGNDLKETTKTTRLFRKVSGLNLIKSDVSDYCFSTSESKILSSHGEFAIVLSEGNYFGKYDSKDADAGKDFGYDEFRVEFSKDELISKIEAIVVPDSWNDDIDESLYGTDKDPMEWIENLRQFGKVIFESESNFNMDFNF